MDFRYVFLLVGSLSYIEAQGMTKVRLQLLSFDSHGKDVHGDNCDSGPIFEECDPKFKFCLDRHPGSSSMNTCPLYSRTTGHYEDDDSMSFGSSIQGVLNPIEVTMDYYAGIRFKVEVTDVDSEYDNQIDTFDWTYTSNPDRNESQSNRVTYTLTGRRSSRPSSLTLDINVYCDTNSYGDDCSVHCIPVDQDNVGHYGCEHNTGEKYCLNGWEDLARDCLIVVDNCEGVACLNGGVCMDLYDDFTCHCPPGSTGDLCETDINECSSDPCLNGGLCLDSLNRYTCICHTFTTFSYCALHACELCRNGATCMEQVDDTIRCICPRLFSGTHCEVNACQTLNCDHGICWHGECECDENFRGPLCDVRECEAIPCQSGV